MWEIVAIGALIGCCAAGTLLTAVRLPGTWLIVSGALLYGWWGDWQDVTLKMVLVLVAAAVVGEAAELLTSVLTARRAGASRRAAWGGLLGGILGMCFLTFLVPIPLIGSMVGALVGCFAGATIGELSVHRQLKKGTRVGVFSVVGFVLGAMAKLAIAMFMAGILLMSVLSSAPDATTGVPAESVSVGVAHLIDHT